MSFLCHFSITSCVLETVSLQSIGLLVPGVGLRTLDPTRVSTRKSG